MAQSRRADLISAVRFYIDKMLSDPSVSGEDFIHFNLSSTKNLYISTMLGMKVLLLDHVTTRIVSMVYSQTQILDKEVYLVERLDKSREVMSHLKAVVFVQPTEANFDIISRDLANPRFKDYSIFFSNSVPAEMLSRLARQDQHELVMQVHEYYADFLAVNKDLFHLGVDNSLCLSSTLSRTLESGAIFDRNVSGLLSVLLALKKLPVQVRYQQSSEVARRIANEVFTQIGKGEPFDFARNESTLLLILDRKDDPITPLLTQWTYQAMVHELLGLNMNRVNLKKSPNVPKDMEEVVLSVTQDEFFAKNCHSNFGDLGTSVKLMLDEYQKHNKKNENINSIEDMQAFLERYPDFRAKSINITKHVTVIGELSRLVDACKLLDISELEQEIACSTDHNAHKSELLNKIRNPLVKDADKLRLSMLYLIKYESYDEIREIKAALAERANMGSSELRLLDGLLDYAGESRRAPGLFSGQGILSKLTKTFTNVDGVQNVYTQHQPLLLQTIQSVVSGKIRADQFPLLTLPGSSTASKITEIVVFITGGVTYEEAARVAEFNATSSSVRVHLGGSTIQNSKSFLEEIGRTFVR